MPNDLHGKKRYWDFTYQGTCFNIFSKRVTMMAYRKKAKTLNVIIRPIKNQTKSSEEVWQKVGPLLACILAQAINKAQQNHLR